MLSIGICKDEAEVGRSGITRRRERPGAGEKLEN